MDKFVFGKLAIWKPDQFSNGQPIWPILIVLYIVNKNLIDNLLYKCFKNKFKWPYIYSDGRFVSKIGMVQIGMVANFNHLNTGQTRQNFKLTLIVLYKKNLHLILGLQIKNRGCQLFRPNFFSNSTTLLPTLSPTLSSTLSGLYFVWKLVRFLNAFKIWTIWHTDKNWIWLNRTVWFWMLTVLIKL